MSRRILSLAMGSFIATSMLSCAPSVEHGQRAPACVGEACGEGVGAPGAAGTVGQGSDTTGGGSPSGPSGSVADGGIVTDDAGGGTSTTPVVPGGGTDGATLGP